MQTSSDTYVAFGTNSNTNAVSVASSLPDASGAVNYQFETNHLQLSTIFGTSETARRGVCMNPSVKVNGLQTFVAFNIPQDLPSGTTAVEVWMSQKNGATRIGAAVKRVGANHELELSQRAERSSQSAVLQASTDYILLIAVEEAGGYVSNVVCIVTTYSLFRKTNLLVTR
jgi:hypothetical protein